MPPFSWKTRSVNMGKGLVIDNHVILRHYRKQTKTKIQQSVQPLDINVQVLIIKLTTQRQSILKRRKTCCDTPFNNQDTSVMTRRSGGREKVFKQVRRDNTWWVVLFSCALQKHGALADIVKRKATKKLTRWGEDSGDSKGAQKTTVQNAGETQRHRRYLQVPRGGYPHVPRGTQVSGCWRPGVPPGQRGKQGSYLAGDGLLPLGAQLAREVGGDPCCNHHSQHNHLAVGRENVTCLRGKNWK